jgi:hypothetical protein
VTPPCADCGRRVELRGRGPKGRICSNCYRQRHTGVCGTCGEHRPVVGRDPHDRPWCRRCRKRHRAAAAVEQDRASIVAAVAAVEPHLPWKAIAAALASSATTTKQVRAIARHLAEQSDALLDGPTSTLAPLDRLVRVLLAAGAKRITVRDPVCAGCGRQQPRHTRRDGGLCSGCYARSQRRACARCGRPMRPNRRDEQGRPWCVTCVVAQRRREEHAVLAQQLADQVHATIADDLDRQAVLEVIERAAPRHHDRRVLLAHLPQPQPWTGHLPVLVARLVNALAEAGATRSLPVLACHDCDQPAGTPASLTRDRIRCGQCVRRCPGCGRDARLPGERVCHRCRKDYHRRRGTCADCARDEVVLDDQNRCWPCGQRARRRCGLCHGDGRLTRQDGLEICLACALRRDLDQLVPNDGEGPWRRLRAAILAANPLTTRWWLAKQRTTTVLAGLRSGEVPLEHAALDQLQPGRDLEHLRALLVTAGILPPDPTRPLTRVTRDLDRLLANIAEPDGRGVRAWLAWQVLPRLRRLAGDGRDITTAALGARATLKQVVAFLAQLHADGQQLSTCRQQDLDAWLAGRIANRYRIRPFLAWAQQRRHLAAALQLPPSYRGQPEQPTDAEHRWTLARRLVTDDTIDPAARVAAALVILYAQPLARVAALTTTHVHRDGERVTVALGPDQLELPEPFATLISSLPRSRADSPAAHLPTAWLFPGSRPGRHLGPVALARWLRELDIQPVPMRLSALNQLAAELPPGILSSMLGIRPTTSARWTGLSGGNWTHYPGKPLPAGHGDTR